jgi:hypothetical protein
MLIIFRQINNNILTGNTPVLMLKNIKFATVHYG